MWCEMKLTRHDGAQDTLTFSVESEAEAMQVYQAFTAPRADKMKAETPEIAKAA